MEKCQEELLGHMLDQQQHQQQQTIEKQQSPFLSPTTPAWGDRNVNEQSAETNNNFSFTFAHSIPSTSDSRISTNSLSFLKNSSSLSTNLTENTSTNNQSSIDGSQLPRKCKLCSYVAIDRTEYIDHIIAHCTFTKSTYKFDNMLLNGYIDDEERDDSGNESQPNKAKKRPKIPKPKVCNKCEFVAKTKLSLWLHMRKHFMQEDCPGFVCIICPFATMLKHHMTFHWFSAHDDFKGFMCTECAYTCVSKSMLTSHMKTHSEVYQYNCSNCSYRTKFCNAMKKHLKETMHVPGPVLNPDGTPNPFATIDVYGSKRGPRRRPLIEERMDLADTTENGPSTSGIILPSLTVPTSSASVSLSPISTTTISDSPDSRTLTSPIRTPPFKVSPVWTPPTSARSSNSLITNNLIDRTDNESGINSLDPSDINELQVMSQVSEFTELCYLMFKDMETRPDLSDEDRGRVFRLLRNARRFLVKDEYANNGDLSDIEKFSTPAAINEFAVPMAVDEPSTSTTLISESQSRTQENGTSDEPLDLSMSAMSKIRTQPQFQKSVASSSSRRKRKRKATKLEYFTVNKNTNDNGTEILNQIDMKLSLPTPLIVSQSDLQRRNETLNVTHNANIYNSSFICYHCHIIFANEIMYAMHMSFHNAKNPLVCALCNRKSVNKVAFFLHLIRTKH